MSEQLPPDLSRPDRAGWLAALAEYGDERGYCEPLGDGHTAVFCDEGPVLLVSFIAADEARVRPMGLPQGMANALARGWSSLTIVSHEPGWFRDARIYGFFDRLVDEGFFEDFDRVVFLGAGQAAHAACAYSVAAPGATVLAFQPRARAEATRSPGETHRSDERYSYAPAMIEAAERAYLFYDPAAVADKLNAALFRCENCVTVPVRHSGGDPFDLIAGMGVLGEVLDILGTPEGLTPLRLYRSLRRRRAHHPYTRRLITTLAAKGRTFQLAKASRHLFVAMGRGRYTKDYQTSIQALEEAGLSLPEPLRRPPPQPAAPPPARQEIA